MFQWIFRKRGQIQIEDFVQGDIVISTDEEKAQVLTTTFFPSLPIATSPTQKTIEHAWSTHRHPSPEECEKVTPKEILSVIQSMHIDIAPGVDGIPVICLRKVLWHFAPLVNADFWWFFYGGLFPTSVAHCKGTSSLQAKEGELCKPP